MLREKLSTSPGRTTARPWNDAAIFVFDVEGTLVDTVIPTLRCWRETLHDAGYEVSLTDLQRLSGMGGHEMLAQLLPATSRRERDALIEWQGRAISERFSASGHCLSGRPTPVRGAEASAAPNRARDRLPAR